MAAALLGLPAVAAALALAGLSPVFAQETPIRVSSNAPAVLLVGGLETDKLPVAVQPGAEVCIGSRVFYPADGDRWTFQAWSDGRTTDCITVKAPGVYKALYTHEVLVLVNSAVAGLRKSLWTLRGQPLAVEAPETVADGDRVRYRFQQWSKGETPFSAKNTIAPLAPTELEAKFAKEYSVTVQGPQGTAVGGSGWYADGASLVLQAPDIIAGQSASERQKFLRWESFGLPSLAVPTPNAAVTTIKVDGPYNLRPVYQKQYLVTATAPFGIVKREWVDDGADVPLEVPPTVDITPGAERLVFKRWEGQEGLVSPKIGGSAVGPVVLRAVYGREFMVTVKGPYGASGDGWYVEGTTATVSVPASVENKLIFRRSFVGFPGYGKDSTVTVAVRGPVTLRAAYDNGVDLRVLGLLIALPIEVAIIFYGSWWLFRRTWGYRPRPRDTSG